MIVKKATRLRPTTESPIGARLVLKTRWETQQFVRTGELEGFTFEGKEFLGA